MDSQYKIYNRILAGIVFIISLIIYLLTMAPTTSFWDCGEFIATSVIMGVPHPPGSPLFLLLGNVFSQLPFFSDIGARVNLISPIVSALAVLLLYLIIVQLVEEWRGPIKDQTDAITSFGGAFLGALTFAFTDSHWFNAVEAEVYAMSTFFTAIIVWLILKWSQNTGKPGNVRYILLIAYCVGLAIGIHLLNLLAFPFIALIIYYKKYKITPLSFVGVIVVTGLAFAIVYLGVIKGIPNLLNKTGLLFTIVILFSVFIATVYFIWSKKAFLATLFASLALILIGYSTYTTIFIRATQNPAINENAPDSIDGAISYLNREQYGDWDIFSRKATLQRAENVYWKRYTNNPSDPKPEEVRSFIWNYQVKEMYLRYFAWQFIGRGDMDWPVKNLRGKIIRFKDGINPTRYLIPLPFILGLLGMGHHFKKDWKRALGVLALFITTGLLIILYLNQYDPQPRERDYSYVGSFFAFSIWIGIGITGLMEVIQKYLKNTKSSRSISFAALIAIFILMPVNMLAKDYKEHNRNGNYVAWDYAYNMLNSCKPDGIIFTNGDNDTFPLWYLQEVMDIRKDIRVVNLSLLNTPWYIKQLRDDPPQIPIKMSDQSIQNITPILWEKKTVELMGLSGSGEKLSWELKPTYAGRYLRVQDLMIYRILVDLNWERPVYFAVTVSPKNQIGLDQYLKMEGLVYRVTSTSEGEINYDRMLQNITQTSNLDKLITTSDEYLAHLASGDGVYRYRNLDNPDVYFNSNIQRLIQNYRSSFLRLALNDVYDEDTSRQENALRVLKDMDTYFPPDVLPYNNPDLEFQIAQLYNRSGDEQEFRSRLSDIEKEKNLSLDTEYYIGKVYLDELADYPSAIRVFKKLYDQPQYSEIPEIMNGLALAYARNGEDENAISILENWLIMHPEDEDARQLMNLLKKDPS
ncbi:MAG: protein O-mannosyl-transferase family [Fidelibacterota bacterium]